MASRRIYPGQNLPGIRSVDHNDFVATAEKVRNMRTVHTGTGASDGAQRVTCLIRNETGDDIDEPFPVLEIIKPRYTVEDDEGVIRRGTVFEGLTPGVGVSINDVVIVQGAIPYEVGPKGYREAVIFGPTWCRLFVEDEAHTHAIPKDEDNTQLVSSDGSTGGVPIVWKEEGTGTVWAYIIMGSCCGGGGGGDCVISVGCGLTIVDNVLQINASLLAGLGITSSGECDLDVNTGDGLEISGGGQIQVNLARGLTFTAGPREVEADLSCGLEFSGNAIRVKRADLIGLGLEGDTGTCNLRVKLHPTTSCLILDSNGLRVDSACLAGSMITPGCGLDFDEGDLVVVASDLAGTGLVTEGTCGLAVNPGCGLETSGDTVRVKRSDLIGQGLENGLGTCNLQVKLGSCLVFDGGGAVAVDSECLVGDTISPGCGLEFDSGDLRVKSSDLAGTGLVAEGECGLAVNPGCGLENSGDTVRVKRADLAGLGLEAGAGTCDLKIKLATSSCLILDSNGLKVDASCLVGSAITPGCGLEFFGGDLRVKASDLAAGGLVTSGTCGLAVNPGCGVELSGDTVAVKASDLAGDGLVTGTGCTVNVAAGCGISVTANAVAVNRAALLGQGLEADSGTCNIRLKLGSCLQFDMSGAVAVDSACLVGDTITPGCGLEFSGGALRVKSSDLAAEGLVTSGTCGLRVNAGCGIEVVSDAVRVKASDLVSGTSGLVTAGSCGLAVNPGCGIEISSNAVRVKNSDLAGSGLVAEGTCGLAVGAGCGITVAADTVSVNAATLAGAGLLVSSGCTLAVGAGCGISVAADSIAVDAAQLAGTGLVVSSGCTLAVNPGCGIQLTGDTVAVKASDLAPSNSGLLTSGTCGLRVAVGCGLEIEGTFGTVQVKAADLAGSGLVASGTCGLSVGAGCGITVAADTVSVNAATLAGSGLLVSSGCTLAVGAGCGITVAADSIAVKTDATKGLTCDATNGLQVKLGSCLQFDGSGNVQVNPSCLTGTTYTAGCGLVLGGNTFSVNAATLAGAGLISTIPCGLNVGAGCGISVGADTVSINRAALLGQGLEADSGTCNMKVKLGNCLMFDGNNAVAVDAACLGGALTPGCGISIVGSTVSVNNASLAGSGLAVGSGCSLNVNAGCGLQIVSGQVRVRNTDLAGGGLVASGTCGLSVNPGCGLQISGSNQLTIKNTDIAGPTASGLIPDGTCGVKVNVGCGLQINSNAVRVNSVELAGGGLTTESACSGAGTALRVNAGCGIQLIDDAVWVKATDLAGNGLVATGGSSCSLAVNPGCGIEVVADQVRVKPSDLVGTAATTGLVTSGNCGISFDKTTAGEFTLNSLNSCTLTLNTTLNQLELRLNVTPYLFRRNAALIPTLISPGAPVNIGPCVLPLTTCT